MQTREIEEHREKWTAVACRVTENLDDAQDAYQDAIIKLSCHQEVSDTYAFFRTILVNGAIDIRRKRNTRRCSDIDSVVYDDSENHADGSWQIDKSPSPFDSVVAILDMESTMRVVKTMAPKRQDVVKMVAVGFVESEIAQRLGLGEDNIKNDKFRARRMLSRSLPNVAKG
jgi:DNA-directed RNA polymerase specialized sigma24 family protein